LHGAIFEDENELLAGMTDVLKGIPGEELEAAFDEWLLRLDAYIRRQGASVE
jgi:hypothetical protein